MRVQASQTGIDFEFYEPQWLTDLLPPGVTPEALNDVLSPPKSTPDAGRAAARQFTEIMRMENVEEIGPDIIACVLAEVRENVDVLVPGNFPPPPTHARMPSPVKTVTPIALSEQNWSARQALERLLPLARDWSADAVLFGLKSSPLEGAADTRQKNGRLD